MGEREEGLQGSGWLLSCPELPKHRGKGHTATSNHGTLPLTSRRSPPWVTRPTFTGAKNQDGVRKSNPAGRGLVHAKPLLASPVIHFWEPWVTARAACPQPLHAGGAPGLRA